MAQLGGLIMIDPSSEAAKNNFFFGGVDNCKWRRPVVPGDCLVGVVSTLTDFLALLPLLHAVLSTILRIVSTIILDCTVCTVKTT